MSQSGGLSRPSSRSRGTRRQDREDRDGWTITADITAEETAIRRHVERIVEAIGAKELDALRPLFAEDVVQVSVPFDVATGRGVADLEP